MSTELMAQSSIVRSQKSVKRYTANKATTKRPNMTIASSICKIFKTNMARWDQLAKRIMLGINQKLR